MSFSVDKSYEEHVDGSEAKEEAAKNLLRAESSISIFMNNLTGGVEGSIARETQTTFLLKADYDMDDLDALVRALSYCFVTLGEAKAALLEREGLDASEMILNYAQLSSTLTGLFETIDKFKRGEIDPEDLTGME